MKLEILSDEAIWDLIGESKTTYEEDLRAVAREAERYRTEQIVEWIEARKETSLFNKHGNVYIDPDEWQELKKEVKK